MSVEKPLPINLPAFTLLEEPELAFASGDPKARHRHPLLGLSRFGAFDQASYRHYSQDLRVAYVGPKSGAALVRDMRGGKLYDAAFGKRMSGVGPYAWMIGRRFEMALEKIGYPKSRARLRTDLFTPPARQGQQLSLFQM